jgi:hypothetical protein
MARHELIHQTCPADPPQDHADMTPMVFRRIFSPLSNLLLWQRTPAPTLLAALAQINGDQNCEARAGVYFCAPNATHYGLASADDSLRAYRCRALRFSNGQNVDFYLDRALHEDVGVMLLADIVAVVDQFIDVVGAGVHFFPMRLHALRFHTAAEYIHQGHYGLNLSASGFHQDWIPAVAPERQQSFTLAINYLGPTTEFIRAGTYRQVIARYADSISNPDSLDEAARAEIEDAAPAARMGTHGALGPLDVALFRCNQPPGSVSPPDPGRFNHHVACIHRAPRPTHPSKRLTLVLHGALERGW